MAAPHVAAIYSVQDAKNKVSTFQIKFPINSDIAVLQDFVITTATMVNNLIKGKIISAGIALIVDLAGATIRATPDPDSDVEEGAKFLWNAASGAITGFRLPTFDEAKLSAGSNAVDLTDADVDTFHDRIIEGRTIALTNVSPSDDRGSDIESIRSALEAFTATRT